MSGLKFEAPANRRATAPRWKPLGHPATRRRQSSSDFLEQVAKARRLAFLAKVPLPGALVFHNGCEAIDIQAFLAFAHLSLMAEGT